MKKILLIMVFFVAFVAKSQTTEEEYNYLTKGIKIQKDAGLDMKKGYRLDTITSHYIQNGLRSTDFYALFRGVEKKPCALLCVYTNKETKGVGYICIPHFDTQYDLWQRTHDQVSTYGEDAQKAILWGSMKLASYYSSK